MNTYLLEQIAASIWRIEMGSSQIIFSKKWAIVWLTAIFGLMHPSLLTVECDEASAESSSFSTFDHLSRLFFCSNANLVPWVVFSYAAVMAAPKNKLDLWVFKRSAFFQSSKNISSPCVIHSLRFKTNEIIKNSTFICKFLYIGIFHFETMIDFNYSKVYN